MILIIFAATAVLVVVVGAIGNRIVDGAGNALRRRKKDEKLSEVQSLAQRYRESAPADRADQTPDDRVCPRCAKKTSPDAAFCPECGVRFSVNNH